MKKRFSAVIAAVLALSLALTACGSSVSSSVASSEAASSEASSEETVSFTGDGYDDSVDYAALAGTTITVAASPTPHAEILAIAAEYLAAADIELKVIEYDDYVQPNNVVEEGEVFANYFQHQPYLDSFNEENGTHIVSVAGIHVEPMAVYAGKGTSLDALQEGDQIAVPNDTTNEARALLLLQEAGVITLDEDAGITATKLDIVENPYGIEIVEVEAANIPNTLPDVAFGVINGNYAVEAGLNPVDDSVAIEGSASAYVNVICVKEGNEELDETKAPVAAVESEKVREYIDSTYSNGSVVSVF